MNSLKKTTLYILVQICIIAFCKSNEVLPDEFVDPHSFYYERSSKKAIGSSDNDSEETENGITGVVPFEEELQARRAAKNSDIGDDVMSKRIINLLLLHADLERDGDTMKGSIYISATVYQIETLKSYGNGKISLRELDAILSDIIVPPSYDAFKSVYSILGRIMETLLENKRTTLFTIGSLYAVWLISRVTWNFRTITLFFFLVIFAMSFFMTWWRLSEEANIKLAAMQVKYTKMPVHCEPEKMTMWDKIVANVLYMDDCEKYFEARVKTPLLQVTPDQVLSHLCTKFVLHPIELVGEAIGNFIHKATANVSWPMRWFVTVLLFVGVILFIMVLPFCLTGGSLGFGLGPFLYFKLRGRAPSENVGRLSVRESRRPVEMIQEDTTARSIDASPTERSEKSRSGDRGARNREEKTNYLEDAHSEKAAAVKEGREKHGDASPKTELGSGDN